MLEQQEKVCAQEREDKLHLSTVATLLYHQRQKPPWLRGVRLKGQSGHPDPQHPLFVFI